MALIPESGTGLENVDTIIPGKAKEAKPRIYHCGEVFAERYEIQNLIAHGALGSLYLAIDRPEERHVALKIMRSELLVQSAVKRRFERFLNLGESLEHTNLVRVLLHGEWQGQPYLVRNFIEGQSLDQLIIHRKKPQNQKGSTQGGRTFSLEEVLNIFNEVGKGLEAVEKRTYHGGLTPSNILITDDSVRVTDLAFARIFQPAQFSSLQIYYGNGYYYLAPEYDRAGSVIDQRADLYSAAVIAYEMLTGDLPRTPIVPPSVVNPDISPGLDGPFLKALDANPGARQKNLSQFIQQLRSLSGLKEFNSKIEMVSSHETVKPKNLIAFASAEVGEKPADKKKIKDLVLTKEISLSKSDASKKRLSEAIEKQLKAHAEESVSEPPVLNIETKKKRTPKKKNRFTPFLTIPLEKARSAQGIALPQISKNTPLFPPVIKTTLAQHWPWVFLAFGVLFAIFMWSQWVPHLSNPNLVTRVPETLQEESVIAPKQNPVVKKEIAILETKPPPKKLLEVKKSAPPKKEESGSLPPKTVKKAAITKGAAALALVPLENRCPKDMVYIEGGEFTYGSQSQDRDFLEFSARQITVESFCVDLYEWPNRKGAKPETNVSYYQAARACEQSGKRLCSEIEWERACKGPQQEAYSYASQFQKNRCNTKEQTAGAKGVSSSGAFRGCQNSWGISDMNGNAAEWTKGYLDKEKKDRIFRGGSYQSSSWASSCTSRKNRLPDYSSETLGFRCCKN